MVWYTVHSYVAVHTYKYLALVVRCLSYICMGIVHVQYTSPLLTHVDAMNIHSSLTCMISFIRFIFCSLVNTAIHVQNTLPWL